MMENDIRTRVVSLSENILQGLEHINKLVAEGDSQQTLELMTDILEPMNKKTNSRYLQY